MNISAKDEKSKNQAAVPEQLSARAPWNTWIFNASRNWDYAGACLKKEIAILRHDPKKNYPRILQAQFRLVFAIARMKKLDNLAESEALCREVMAKLPANPEPYRIYADLAVRQKNWNEAIKRWELFRKEFPNNYLGYYNGAEAWWQFGDLAKAETLCLEGMKILPEDSNCWRMYAEIAMRDIDFKKIFKRWADFREKFPLHPAGYVRAADAWWKLTSIQKNYAEEDLRAAEDICLEGMKKLPQSHEILRKYAELAMQKNDYSEAIKRWAQFRDKFPKQSTGYSRAVEALWQSGDFLAADNLCLEWMKNLPSDVNAWINYAELAMRQCQYQTASQRWLEMLKKFSCHSVAYIGIAECCLIEGETEKAEAICIEALKVLPDHPDLLLERGKIKLTKKDYPAARELYQEFLKKFPLNDKTANARAAVIYCDLGEKSQGKSVIEKSEDSKPNAAVKHKYARINNLPPLRVSRKNKVIISRFNGDEVTAGVGFGDMLRGVLSTYDIAQRLGLEYRIFWTHPFNLQEMLKPNLYDWRINPGEVLDNENYSAFISIVNSNGVNPYPKLLNFINESDYLQYQICTNRNFYPENYNLLFEELFLPGEKLSEEIEGHLTNLGPKYISVTYRFMNMLDDFDEIWTRRRNISPLDPEKQENLIKKCINEILHFFKNLSSSYKILVSSDSSRFRQYIQELDNPKLYTIPGERIHPSSKQPVEKYLTSFLDLYVIMQSEKVFRFSTGNMFRSGFPWFASYAGGKEFFDHVF